MKSDDPGKKDPVDVTPRTVRELRLSFQHQMEKMNLLFQGQMEKMNALFQGQIDLLEKTAVRLNETVEKLKKDSLDEMLGCPLNPARKGDPGQKLLDRVSALENEALVYRESAGDLPNRVKSLETDALAIKTVFRTFQTLGLLNLVGVISLLMAFVALLYKMFVG